MTGAARPNILILIADQWRGDALSCLGHSAARTPATDRLAAEGLLATRAYAQASPCGPARASFLTGSPPSRHGVWRNGQSLAPGVLLLPAAFARAGYDVAYLGYTSFRASTPWPWRDLPGLEGDGKAGYAAFLRARGVADWEAPWGHHLRARQTGPGHPFGWPARLDAAQSELAYLSERICEGLSALREPFLLHAGLPRPHDPFVARRPFAVSVADLPPARAPAGLVDHPLTAAYRRSWPQHLFSGIDTPPHAGRSLADLDPAEIDLLRAAYFALVAETDAAIGRILDALPPALAERTIVVVTSDHGEYAGDYGLFAKHGFLPEAFHIPLAIRDPGADSERGRRIDAPVPAAAILPELAARVGIDAGGARLQDGGPVVSAMDFTHLAEERPDLALPGLPIRARLVHRQDAIEVVFSPAGSLRIALDADGRPIGLARDAS